MKATIPIGIQPGTKLLRIARQPKSQSVETHLIRKWGMAVDRETVTEIEGYWDIWLNTNDFIHGTFLRLYDNGKIERITIRVERPDDDVVLVKPEDA